MPRTSCISEPTNQPLIMIKQWQLDITGGDHCAAALISFYQYWHEVKMAELEQKKKWNKIVEMHGETPNIELGLLQFHNQQELEKGLLGLFGITAIKERNKKLIEIGIITIHKNPNDRYNFDKTNYFLFHPSRVQELLDNLSSPLVENDQPLSECDQPLVENDQAITEITSEISKEREEASTPVSTQNQLTQNEPKNLNQSLNRYCEKIGLNPDEELAWRIKRAISQQKDPQGFLDYLENYRSKKDDFDEKKLKPNFYQNFWYEDYLIWKTENKKYLEKVKEYKPKTEEEYAKESNFNITEFLNQTLLNKQTA